MTRVVGVVLCGGASSRMGADKAMLGPPERPFAAHVAAALHDAGVDDVLLVGGDGPRLSRLGWSWIDDDDPGSGPLAAVATVVRREATSSLLLCACDLPRIAGEDLVPLLEAVDPSRHGQHDRCDVAVFELDGTPQWSAVALSPSGAAHSLGCSDSGERSLRRAFDSPGVRLRRLRAARPDALRDVDRPEDLPDGICIPVSRGTGPPPE